ncbi:MAG: hypothetical protein ACFFA8_09035 [Promethearchaeota archaeon]
MTCIHGFDENYCPTCRIANSIIPLEKLNKNRSDIENLKPYNPFFKQYKVKKNDFERDIFNKRNQLKPNLIKNIPNPTLINNIPNFENKLFQERLNNLKVSKLDNYGINKRIKLGNPNLKLTDDE